MPVLLSCCYYEMIFDVDLKMFINVLVSVGEISAYM